MSTDANTVPTITLNNGVEIPQLGFGVFQIDPAETKDATLAALEVGYRHIDTAEMYGNEAGVGEAVRASGLDRSEVFVTSKLNNGFHAREDALAAIDVTLGELKFDYVDLFLIHWPLPNVGDYLETWKAMEEIYRSGKAKAIAHQNRSTLKVAKKLARYRVLVRVTGSSTGYNTRSVYSVPTAKVTKA